MYILFAVTSCVRLLCYVEFFFGNYMFVMLLIVLLQGIFCNSGDYFFLKRIVLFINYYYVMQVNLYLFIPF